MEIQVVDSIDPYMVRPMSTLKSLSKKVIEMTPGPNGVGRMIDEVIKVAEKPGAITVLRIYAHGSSGEINVAGGRFNEADSLSTLTLDTLPKLKNLLQRLAPYFAPGARVELQGCTVAKDTKGEKFILELARIWGVRIQGSPIEQPVAAVQFTGPVYEATPTGGLLCIPRTEITRDDAAQASDGRR